MAEMDTSSSGGAKKGKGGSRSKKMSTRVDLTPMVDLAFLLITFFMLTTTLNKPKAMDLTVPAKNEDDKDKPEVKESKVFTLILDENDKVYCYKGITDPVLDSTDYAGVGAKIIDAQQTVKEKWGSKDSLIILIKPRNKSAYRNMVDVLDEMSINEVKRYALTEFKDVDSLIINNIVLEE